MKNKRIVFIIQHTLTISIIAIIAGIVLRIAAPPEVPSYIYWICTVVLSSAITGFYYWLIIKPELTKNKLKGS